MHAYQKILNGYEVASIEVCNFVQQNLSKQSLEIDSEALSSTVIYYTMMNSKLIQEDAEICSKITVDVWTRYRMHMDCYTVVSLLEVAG